MSPKILVYKYLLILAILGINYPLKLLPIHAQSISEETSFFRKSPRLIRAATTFRNPRAIATYFFEIKMPEDASDSLQSVVINQQKNSETIKFFPDQTKAFIDNNQQESIPITAELERNEDKNQLKILLKQPVKPGDILTLAIRAKNPLYGGIYQFGVTAYPQGNNPQPLYLGIGRIHFTIPGGRF
jgi:hypothetical protein